MAVALEFINLIIRRSAIEKKYQGGWEKCLADECWMWHDEHLLRDGAMSPAGIESAVRFWGERGLNPTKIADGEKVWDDLCVIEALSRSPTLRCNWIEVAEDASHAWLRRKQPGVVVGPVYDKGDEEYVLVDD